jgi:hypothetical protein
MLEDLICGYREIDPRIVGGKQWQLRATLYDHGSTHDLCPTNVAGIANLLNSDPEVIASVKPITSEWTMIPNCSIYEGLNNDLVKRITRETLTRIPTTCLFLPTFACW